MVFKVVDVKLFLSLTNSNSLLPSTHSFFISLSVSFLETLLWHHIQFPLLYLSLISHLITPPLQLQSQSHYFLLISVSLSLRKTLSQYYCHHHILFSWSPLSHCVTPNSITTPFPLQIHYCSCSSNLKNHAKTRPLPQP